MRARFRRLALGVALGAILTDHWPSVAKVAIPAFLLSFLAFDLWSDWKEAALPTEGAE